MRVNNPKIAITLNRSRRRLLTILSIVIVTALALMLRIRAVRTLPADYDEPIYLAAAQRYAQALSAHDVRAIVDYEYNYEHPPLAKLAYGLAILPLPPAPLLPTPASNIPSSLPSIFVDRSRNVTLAMAISGMIRGGAESWSNLAALAILMSLPVVLIFLVLQKYLVDRLLVGTVAD